MAHRLYNFFNATIAAHAQRTEIKTLKMTQRALQQWLSTFFVLAHTFKFARKPVHPYHALKSTTAKVQNFYAVVVA